ncbi:MAG: 23S rRNA (adenine(2503)-C(2))-methyltransferase RlmN [Chlorobi bacterium]|nr:23S rRNA (adenine(2503)-C(2))-methyltransferase RlmN [Chlorobiota bacterium]
MEKRLNIKNLSIEELQDWVESAGEKKFRASQIFDWLYDKQIENFNEMKNIPKSFYSLLENEFEIQSLSHLTTQISDNTDTKKYLLQTNDKKLIEAVIIPDGEKNTLCISTQVGCPLDCKFCATGLMGYTRNLTAAEIIDQYILTSKLLAPAKITNIVFMGMGEPLLNFDAVMRSLSIFTNKKTKGISRTKITVSTAGLPEKINALAVSDYRVKLALSLHSPFDKIRNEIMPINKKHSLKDLKPALINYAKKTKTRITFEYTMLKGYNDREEDIEGLVKLSKQIPSKINIIPFNSIAHMSPGGLSAELEPTVYDKLFAFAEELRFRGLTVMIRQTQGDDIAAACGQLAVKH